MKLVTVLGARPQFIKAAAVSRAVAAKSDMTEVLVHTGQHFDSNMSDVFFDELEMAAPAYNLGIHGGSHGAMTARMLTAIEEVLMAEMPDCLLVYGDTNSTLAGALAAAKLHIPIAHVEAGVRSFNRRMPEEVNRVLTDHVATFLFAPTATARLNLRNEGVDESAIQVVGDVMYDAALFFSEKADRTSSVLERLGLTKQEYVLATIHRQENTDDLKRLTAIMCGLAALEVPVVLPMHPRTRAKLAGYGIALAANIRVIDPVGYLDMVMLEKNAQVIATDSGGMQKEAFFYQVPCLTLRDETEWVELVELGWNRVLSPVDADEITATIRAQVGVRGRDARPYGDGNAAEIIVRALTE